MAKSNRFRIQHGVFGILTALLLQAGVSLPAFAQEVHRFQINTTDAATAIHEFGNQSGVQILASAEALRGKRLNEVSGDLSTDDGLQRLLADTGLSHRYVGERAVALVSDSVVAGSDSSRAPSAPHAFNNPDPGTAEKKSFWSRFRLAQADTASKSDTQSSSEGPNEKTSENSSESSQKRIELDEVIVTGTHIRGTQKPISPVLVIDAEQIERTGYSSTQDLFESLPQNFDGGQAGASADGIYGTGASRFLNYSYATGVNLRGLGASSTLVLINGHRVAPTGFGTFVDVSAIPLFAIKRVEILTDGSSAIYGSDAVGGVVNILLKDEYQGIQAGARYGTVSEGDRDEKLYSLAGGLAWDGGNAFVSTQYQSVNPLYTHERAVSSEIPPPAMLLPESEMKNVNLSIKQALGENLSVSTDALFSDRDAKGLETDTLTNSLYPVVDQKDLNTSLNFDYAPSERWSMRLSGVYGRQHLTKNQTRFSTAGAVNFTSWEKAIFETSSAELLTNISLWKTRAGTVALAFGGSTRREELVTETISTTLVRPESQTRWSISAGFGELRLPLIGPDHRVPGVKELEFSAAARRDSYSEFGATSTPYFGMRWSIDDAFTFRASYGRSFRAPTVLEFIRAQSPAQMIATGAFFATPSGSKVPAFVLQGSSPDLKPERARSFSFGLDVVPMRDLVLGLNYYDIDYQDRITTPRFDLGALLNLDIYGEIVATFGSDAAAEAFLNDMLAQGVIFRDLTPADGPGANIRWLLDFRQQNAAVLKQKGFDLTAAYSRQLSFGSLSLRANAAHIRNIITGYAGATSLFDQADTNGNPSDLRGRVDVGLDVGMWSMNAGINYVDAYMNTSPAVDVPAASWTTLDLMVRVSPGERFNAQFLKNSRISLSVQNALNAAPPLVFSGLPGTIKYDAANANPLGRFLALDLRKAW